MFSMTLGMSETFGGPFRSVHYGKFEQLQNRATQDVD